VLELFRNRSGAELHPVTYKASAQAVTDVMGGHIALSIDTLIATAPHIASGKLKAVGVSSLKRPAALPSVPTFAESGLANFDLVAWNVWFAPKGTPPEIVSKLNTELVKVLQDPEIQQKLRALGYEPGGPDNAGQVAAFVRAEAQKWGELIRAAGIKAE
jgi:tripartite-type tricarboxylate transporter receptor subunit TctC